MLCQVNNCLKLADQVERLAQGLYFQPHISPSLGVTGNMQKSISETILKTNTVVKEHFFWLGSLFFLELFHEQCYI